MRADVSWQLRVRKSVDVTLKVTMLRNGTKGIIWKLQFFKVKVLLLCESAKDSNKGEWCDATNYVIDDATKCSCNNPFYVFYKEYLILWTNSSRITNFDASRSLDIALV